MTPTRSRRGARIWQGAAVIVVAALTTALTHSTTSAAFTAQTADGGNQVTASTNFCASSGTTLAATGDTTGSEQNPTTAYGSVTAVAVNSEMAANARVLIAFPLPTLPNHCTLSGATLRLYASGPEAGRTVEVYRVDPAASWTEASTTWNTLPATIGAGVGSASLSGAGWQEWTVTSLVTAMYGSTDNGFLLRDRTESSWTGVQQLWGSREDATVAQRPQLVLTWG